MRVQDYETLAASTDAASLQQGLAGFARQRRFESAALALVLGRPAGPAHAALLGPAPAGFLASLQTPTPTGLAAELLGAMLPLTLDAACFARHGGAAAPHEPGFGFGVAACVHLAGRRHVLLRLDRADALDANDEGLLHAQADAQMLVHHLIDTALRLLGPPALGLAAYPRLTAREREVLGWTAQGKSQGLVAQILGVSPHTVDFHLRSLLRKLAVGNKQQAVLRALQLGLLPA
jgi:DNA-binding CsgD family transcriptional regulator